MKNSLDYEINHNYREGYNAGFADGLAAAWIRTAEHKPKSGAEVLISAPTTRGRVFDVATYKAGKFIGKTWNLGAAEVSHWMPKPADPAETEGGGDA